MVKFNPSNYDSSRVGKFEVPTPGTYLIKVIDGNVDMTKNGNEIWKMKYEIKEQNNQFYGQWLFDNLIFTPKTMDCIKLIFEAFGVEMKNEEQVFSADDLLGKFARVQVSHKEKYKNKDGEEREKAVIAFGGYFPVSAKEIDDADEIPF
jgi:hypothetical protein